jgi:hypothetical protein
MDSSVASFVWLEKLTGSFLSEEEKESFLLMATRVARWSICKPKIPIWVDFGGP